MTIDTDKGVSLFGTDGIRARMGRAPLREAELLRLGHAIAHWIEQSVSDKAHIIIAHDTRSSASYLKAMLISSLIRYPFTIHDAGMLPTPALALACKDKGYDVGLMLTASHNPYHDNGIKIFDQRGDKIGANARQQIETFYDRHYASVQYDQFGTVISDPRALHYYHEKLCSIVDQDLLKGMRIVLDGAHGAVSASAAPVLRSLGAHVIALNCEPNGTNINYECGAVFPQQVAAHVVRSGATLGCAFDGDGDRLVLVNRHGEIKDGDDILALLLSHARYANTQSIVGTHMSNSGLETFLLSQGKTLIRTSVGDHHIAKELKTRTLALGGEPSGHTIMAEHLSSSDALYTLLRILEVVCITHNYDLTTFTKYTQSHRTLVVQVRVNLADDPYSTIIARHQTALGSGRLIVRYSGTQPVLRIMVEHENSAYATTQADALANELIAVLPTAPKEKYE